MFNAMYMQKVHLPTFSWSAKNFSNRIDF